MRIIGIQILHPTSNRIRKSLDYGWYPFVKCENNIGENNNETPIVSSELPPQSYYHIHDELPRNISISVIAGKNGSGKSTLLDILYRILNNFSYKLLKNINREEFRTVSYAYGLYASLFYELNGTLYRVKCEDNSVSFDKIVRNNIWEQISIEKGSHKAVNELLKKFFYTISVNYSLYAFNTRDIPSIFKENKDENDDRQESEWIENLFHKNDGYLTPLVLTPQRDEGKIDINKENALALQRLTALTLLFYSQGKEMLVGYKPISVVYKMKENYENERRKALQKEFKDLLLASHIDDLLNKFVEEWKSVLQEMHNVQTAELNKSHIDKCIFFLAYKSVKICLTYTSYKELIHLEQIEKMASNDIENEDVQRKLNMDAWINACTNDVIAVINTILNEKESHITVKIHQCLHFLGNALKYQREKETVDADSNKNYNDFRLPFMNIQGKEDVDFILQNQKYKTYDEVLCLLPPPFFDVDLIMRKKREKNKEYKKEDEEITFSLMSSGERQLLYSLSYVFYHIKNISTIVEDGNRVPYHHINIVFDEAELYYHPEFQRTFVQRMLEMLSWCNIDKRSIFSIGILIVTHSPFILSDIPETNILFLGKSEGKKTFGANIYDLLKSSFFMEYSLGDFAKMKVNDLVDIYYEKDNAKKESLFVEKQNELKFTIEHIGDEYLSNTLSKMYYELGEKLGKEDNTHLRCLIRKKEKELQELKNRLKK